MNYTDKIKQLIASIVKANNNQEITGPLLKKVLDSMTDATEELYKLIQSIEEGGVAVLQDLGDSETMSISQKVLTEYLTRLEDAIENAGAVDDVLVDGESVVGQDKVARIDLSNFGKVDDVEVNGQSVLDPLTKKASINITASVVEDDEPGTPTANATMQDGNINIEFEHVKGDPGDKGDKGDKGDQGDSAVFDPDTGNILATLHNTTGDDDANAMTQRAVTRELRPIRRILRDFEWIDKCMHPGTPSTLQDRAGMRTSLAYPIKEGDKVVVDTANNGTSQFTVIAYLTTADQESGWSNKGTSTYTDGARHKFQWTADADGYARICGYASDMDAYIIVTGALATQVGLDAEKSRINTIEEQIRGKFDGWEWNIGMLHPASASVVNRSDYKYSKPVTVHKGDIVKVKVWYPHVDGGTNARNSCVIAKYSNGTRSLKIGTSGTANSYINITYKCNVDEEQICVCVYVGDQDVEQGYSATIERTDALVKRSDIESVLDGGGLPDYWLAYLSSKMAGFNAGADTFAFISDTHSAENVGNSGEVLHWLAKNKGISKVIHGGDICCTGGPSTSFDNIPTNFEQMLVRDIKAYDRLAERASQYARFFGVKGNHDFFEFSNGMSLGRCTPADVSRHIKGLMTDLGVRDNMQVDTVSLYYYYDNSIAKIRYIFLDTCHNSIEFIQVGIEQLTWLIATLNGTPNDYKVIVIGHSPASTYMAPSDETSQDKIGCVREMLIKANAKESGTCHYYHHSSGMDTEEGYVPYDFSGFNGEVIAYVHGHTHVDNQVYHEGIPFIGIICDKAGQHPYSPFCEGTEMAVSNKSVGTAKEQAIDVATINSTKDVISMRRIGIGFDRHFHIGVVELEVGQTLTLSPSFITAASYGGADENSTISNGVWTYEHDYATINTSTGLVTAVAPGDVIAFAEDAEHNKEFWHIKVTA